MNKIVVAFAGNPNSGKTTLFNAITGSRQHVGNWPGVTVEHKEGTASKDDYTFKVIDLPGIYSLSAYSQEEKVARDFLLNNHVDVIVNIVDASNIERNLYLTTQLLELGIDVVVVLNMIDMAKSLGQKIDIKGFAEMLGVKVVSAVASKGQGIPEILDAVIESKSCNQCEQPRSARHNVEIETEIAKLEDKLKFRAGFNLPLRWMIIKSLEGDSEAINLLKDHAEKPDECLMHINNAKKHMEIIFNDDLEAVIADGRYGFVGGLMREVVIKAPASNKASITDKIDAVALHRFFGLPIFILLMFLTFKFTFDVGGWFVTYIDNWISIFANFVSSVLPSGPLSSMLVDGIISGVGGVIVFVPNIAVMFILISFLEDSGYMARAAFLMDRSMHLLGLHGKSFIPMLMGFGCNVPAVMASRTLESKEDRLITILINPFMSCTARLPIYILLTGVFFSKNGAWVIFSIYAVGILIAVLSGKLFRKTLFKNAVSPFVMELPPYRMPTFNGTVIHVWEKVSLFVTKAGTIILAVSIVIWALGSLPWGVKFGSEQSIIGHIGKMMEPVVKPLGLSWKASVALLFGIGAKEIVVSTLSVLSGAHSEAKHLGLQGAMRQTFTPLSAYVFMIISLIYIPCAATIATIKRETNSWKWTIFSVSYSLMLAYGLGFLIYNIGKLLGLK